eukprot:694266_1
MRIYYTRSIHIPHRVLLMVTLNLSSHDTQPESTFPSLGLELRLLTTPEATASLHHLRSKCHHMTHTIRTNTHMSWIGSTLTCPQRTTASDVHQSFHNLFQYSHTSSYDTGSTNVCPATGTKQAGASSHMLHPFQVSINSYFRKISSNQTQHLDKIVNTEMVNESDITRGHMMDPNTSRITPKHRTTVSFRMRCHHQVILMMNLAHSVSSSQ